MCVCLRTVLTRMCYFLPITITIVEASPWKHTADTSLGEDTGKASNEDRTLWLPCKH